MGSRYHATSFLSWNAFQLLPFSLKLGSQEMVLACKLSTEHTAQWSYTIAGYVLDQIGVLECLNKRNKRSVIYLSRLRD